MAALGIDRFGQIVCEARRLESVNGWQPWILMGLCTDIFTRNRYYVMSVDYTIHGWQHWVYMGPCRYYVKYVDFSNHEWQHWALMGSSN